MMRLRSGSNITGWTKCRTWKFPQINGQKRKKMFGGEDTEVVLRGSSSLVGVVIDRFGKDIWIRPDGEEHFRARVLVAVSPQFYGWVTGIGLGLEILGPSHVREGMKTYLAKVLEQYEA